jgi:hypothetical protein
VYALELENLLPHPVRKGVTDALFFLNGRKSGKQATPIKTGRKSQN